MSWWARTDIRHIGEGSGPRFIDGTTTSVMAGGDMRLGPNHGIGFGIGYSHGDSRQLDAFGGGSLDFDGVNMILRGFWGPRADLLFDVNVTYGYADYTNVRTTFSDRFDTHTFGIGFGINKVHEFSALWRAEGRLGWSGTHSIRQTSTDTTGFTTGRVTANFGRAGLSGRLVRKFKNRRGHIYVDAALHAVTNDDSVANFDNQPFEGEIGAGIRTALGGAATLSARAFAASLERGGRSEYGGSVRLGLDF